LKAPNKSQYSQAGLTIHKWGEDNTGKIEYKFNSLGYRSNIEYNFIPEYAFFGASCVFGTGVDENKIFSSYFTNAFNFGLQTSELEKYGIDGKYDHLDILSTLINFNHSQLFNNHTKVAVVWTDRPNQPVDKFINICNNILDFKLYHFKVGKHDSTLSINLKPNIDTDVSKTHGGPKTHKLWHYQIQKVLKQL